MVLATTERAHVSMFVLGVRAVAAVALHIPEDAKGMVVRGDEAMAGAFRPCWFSVKEFGRC